MLASIAKVEERADDHEPRSEDHEDEGQDLFVAWRRHGGSGVSMRRMVPANRDRVAGTQHGCMHR